MTAHLLGALEPDGDGFVFVACHGCKWKGGPFPDDETAIDALIEHALDAFRNAPGRRTHRLAERYLYDATFHAIVETIRLAILNADDLVDGCLVAAEALEKAGAAFAGAAILRGGAS